MDVRPLVVMRADLPVKIIDKLRRCLTRLGHQVEEIKTGEDAIAFGDMTAKTVAAALFTADKSVFSTHNWRYVFEADRSLKYRHVKYLAEPVKHAGAGDGLHQWAALTTYFQQVKREQGKDLELG